jgi:Xaa-Pro aminopeptidase
LASIATGEDVKSTAFRFALLASALFITCIFNSVATSHVTAANEKKLPALIKVTPEAPAFLETERLNELLQRRARVAQAIGNKSFLILFSGELRVYANDVDYPFRQENNLFYLTQLKQAGATLVVLPGNNQFPEILFLPKRSALAETWTGHMYSAQEAKQISGVKEIWNATELDPFLKSIRNRQPYRPKAENILLSDLPASFEFHNGHGFEPLFAAAADDAASLFMLVPRAQDSSEYRREQQFASEWAKVASGYAVKNAWRIFNEMRLSKSPMELRLLQHAIDISTEAHERSWLAAASAKWEYEIDAEVAYTFKLRNADNWGYPDIVGCGPNATTLHYIESQSAVKPGDLLLMDVGAEYQHYSADITRTIPVNGRFSPAQAEVYQVVYEAQEAVAKASRPGATLSDVNRAGTDVIKQGLLKLGLITDVESNQYRMWFMHNTSHWLGMNVHDVGGPAKFVPGAVFTNEPGIYVRPDALENKPGSWKDDEWEKFKTAVRPAFEKYKGIGVRIEDDMVVTADGVEWMSKALPRKLSEVEEFIAKIRSGS